MLPRKKVFSEHKISVPDNVVDDFVSFLANGEFCDWLLSVACRQLFIHATSPPKLMKLATYDFCTKLFKSLQYADTYQACRQMVC